MGHSALSPSQTKQWTTCPGSVAFIQANTVDDPSSPAAQMGTCAHALVERCLKEGSEPIDYAGRLIQIIGEDGGTSILKKGAKWPKDPSAIIFEVDQDMHEAVTKMTDYVRHRCAELGLFTYTSDARLDVANLVKNGTVRLEARTSALPERDDASGTSDVVIDAWPEVIEVIDYKNGSGVFVSVKGNHQTKNYLTGALQEVGASNYEMAIHTICQPRHSQSPPNGIMTEKIAPKELMEWKTWLAGRAAIVDEARYLIKTENANLQALFDNGYISVGEDGAHCTFCPLMIECPAVLAKAKETAAVDFEDVPEEIDVPVGGNHLTMVLPWVPLLNKWLKALMERAEQLAFSGKSVVGMKVVRGKSSGRKWVPTKTEDEIAHELASDFGIEKEKMYTIPNFLTGPAMEKLVPPKERGKLSDSLMIKPEGKLIVVPESDTRIAIKVDPAADFDDLDE